MDMDKDKLTTEDINLIENAATGLKNNGLAVTLSALRAILGASRERIIAQWLAPPKPSLILTAIHHDKEQSPTGFSDEQLINNNVTGSLSGCVLFAQHHTVQAQDNSSKELPTLVSARRALLMFIPSSPQKIQSLYVSHPAYPSDKITLMLPEHLPASNQPMDDAQAPLKYSTRAWSAALPAAWMQPGLELLFHDDQGRNGTLSADKIEFEAPAELVLQNIRIGMLTEPGSDHWFEQHPAIAGLDYFQKMPIAKLTVASYLPLFIPMIRMPNGKLYRTASDAHGGVYEGDLRENIGKALISIGINNANFGLVDTAGSAQVQPQHYRQVVVHTSVGNYANGIQQHGLSGGNGMATLISTSGNEFSHELGHNYALGHYPGGGKWSAQHPDSGWGFDDWRQRFIGNINWEALPRNVDIHGVVTPPFKGQYTFNTDPMASGTPSGDITQLTLHTGYSLRRVQQVFSATPVIDPASPTGYRKWNHNTRSMEVHDAGWPIPIHFGVPVVTLVGYFDPEGRYPTYMLALHGNYGHVYSLPEPVADEPYLEIHGDSPNTNLNIKVALSPRRLATSEMNKFHINIRQSDLPVIVGFRNMEESFYIDILPQPLDAPVVIGGPGLWEKAIVPRMPDFTQWRPVPRKLESIDALEAQLRNLYGELHVWSEDQCYTKRRPGELYVFDNPVTAKRQYFLLKNEDYRDFPQDSTDNADWRLLGDMDRLVNIRPNPLKARQIIASSLDEAICAYYRASLIKCPPDGTASGSAGSLWFRESDQGYYLQRAERATCAELPSGTDNVKFFFLGFVADLNKLFREPINQADFDQRILEWYDIPRFRRWDERSGETIGEIFDYNNPYGHTRDYFAQKSRDAGYFPGDHTSRNGWIYLGSYK